MDRKIFFSELRLTGMLLIFSRVIFLVAAILFTIRFLWELPMGRMPSFFLWERSFVIAALLAVLLSFTLLKRVLEAAGDGILASMALVLFLVAVILVVVAETISFPSDDIVYPPLAGSSSIQSPCPIRHVSKVHWQNSVEQTARLVLGMNALLEAVCIIPVFSFSPY